MAGIGRRIKGSSKACEKELEYVGEVKAMSVEKET
jgi:hypothetical protein